MMQLCHGAVIQPDVNTIPQGTVISSTYTLEYRVYSRSVEKHCAQYKSVRQCYFQVCNSNIPFKCELPRGVRTVRFNVENYDSNNNINTHTITSYYFLKYELDLYYLVNHLCM